MPVRYRAHPSSRAFRRRDYTKNYELLRRYGITLETYRRIFEAQDGGCAICHAPPPQDGNLVVDHDHETGIVRGLLCEPCNFGLGNFRDDPAVLAAAAAYLITAPLREGRCAMSQQLALATEAHDAG